MNKFIFILIVFMFIVPETEILAHGEEGPKDHRPTQIGADESLFPGIFEKLSREEVSSLVSPTLEQEDARASIKFIILVLLLYTVCWLFFPKKPSLFQQKKTALATTPTEPPASA